MHCPRRKNQRRKFLRGVLPSHAQGVSQASALRMSTLLSFPIRLRFPSLTDTDDLEDIPRRSPTQTSDRDLGPYSGEGDGTISKYEEIPRDLRQDRKQHNFNFDFTILIESGKSYPEDGSVR